MAKNTRIWCDIHLLLSCFFLPIALLYAITGGLTAMGVKGESHGPRPQAGVMGRAPGAGGPSAGEGFRGGNPEAMGERGGPFQGRKKPTGTFDRLMLLHKAKGGVVFNILGVAFAVAMLTMYISGVVIGWAVPGKRRQMLIATALGLVVTVAAVIVSL